MDILPISHPVPYSKTEVFLFVISGIILTGIAVIAGILLYKRRIQKSKTHAPPFPYNSKREIQRSAFQILERLFPFGN